MSGNNEICYSSYMRVYLFQTNVYNDDDYTEAEEGVQRKFLISREILWCSFCS
jgi:hypothetical protein